MIVPAEITDYINAQPERKRGEMQTSAYADGRTREFYQIGLSANTTGISVYIMGLDDKTYLAQTYGGDVGKASVTGYCIKFRTLRNVNVDVLTAAMRDGIEQTGA